MLCDACKHPFLPPHALPTPEQTDALRQFLMSGALPLDTSQYRAQIATSEAGLAGYDAEIWRLQETLRGLFADRSKLQEYADGLRAAMSPVRALPAEILGEIFAPFSQSHKSRNGDEELKNLAESELLELSKVCSRWHRVILGTPHLWSDIAVNFDHWPDNPSEGSQNLNFLRNSLERGAHHPLRLSLTIINDQKFEIDVSALTLLAEHSQRWQHLSFFGFPSILDHISHTKDKLDALETLSFTSWEKPTAVDIFEIAPKLTQVQLELKDAHSSIPVLPWHQLRSVTYTDSSDAQDIFSLAAMMGKLSLPKAAFELRHFSAWKQSVSDDGPQIATNISSFIVKMATYKHRGYDSQSLGELFGCLAFLHLRELSISRSSSRGESIPWSMNQFESLSLRSSFHDTLRVLEIPDVTIIEEDLLRILDSLVSLETLVIGDQFRDIPEHILITDTLLLRLTRTTDSQLIRRLKHFVCTSFMEFSADVYFNFVASRIASGEEPFRCGLRYPAYTLNEFDAGVHQKLLDLVQKGEVDFSIGKEEVP